MATEIKSARDALEKIEKLAPCDLCNVYPKYRAKFDAKIGGIERIAKAALALPRLNCEVGTAEEQYKRFINMCIFRSCKFCPYKAYEGCERERCLINWEQMPYEAKVGGDNGSK